MACIHLRPLVSFIRRVLLTFDRSVAQLAPSGLLGADSGSHVSLSHKWRGSTAVFILQLTTPLPPSFYMRASRVQPWLHEVCNQFSI